jgi:trehalose synthase
MNTLHEVHVRPRPVDRFEPVVGAEYLDFIRREALHLREKLDGRRVWTLNSTAAGGGVAEMLHSLLAYSRELGIDVRWLVTFGSPEFFQITKRLHNALHGSRGDGSSLGAEARRVYEEITSANARALKEKVSPGDVVILHDPQTAGLIPAMVDHGAIVVWRCHIGGDLAHLEVARGWGFLAPFLGRAHAFIFSRQDYVPEHCDPSRAVVVAPSIDPFSAKNQDLDEEAVRSILVQANLVAGPDSQAPPAFTREDGSQDLVSRRAKVDREAGPPAWETPLVVQVSRWDRLKDPIGVLEGFVRLIETTNGAGPELVLAGPNVDGVADDPEGIGVLEQVREAWRALPEEKRRKIHLASIPMDDLEENAAIINALQRHATVVVQKSLQEGFGLTVTEAMWKNRPVIASAVGGIRDQIEDGVHGLLVEDPSNLDDFAGALRRVLDDPEMAARLGDSARRRVREQFLGLRSLMQYAELLSHLL